MSIYCLALLLLCLLPDCLALVWKHSSPASCLLLISLLSLSSWTSTGPISWNPSSPSPPPSHIHCLFHDFFLDWFCCKSVQVGHNNIWTQFSSARIYCFGLDGSHGFFCNHDAIFTGVIQTVVISRCSLLQCWHFFSRSTLCNQL